MNILAPNSLFLRGNRLLLDCANQAINQHDTFVHIQSIFVDEWYNFIVPTVGVGEFNWDEAEEVRISEEKHGKKVSYYVHKELWELFKTELEGRGFEQAGSEVFMYKKLKGGRTSEQEECFVPISDKELGEYIDMGKICFPEWDNNEEFSRYFHSLANQKKENVYYEILLKVEGSYAAYGSIVISPKEKLSYIHNTATLPDFRRKGYFTAVIQHLSRVSLDNGVDEVYALVEEGEASCKGFLKMGYEVRDVFYLYTKEDVQR